MTPAHPPGNPLGHLLVCGLGYAGSAAARRALAAGWRVTGTARDPAQTEGPPGVTLLAFAAAAPAFSTATHLLVTAAPIETSPGDAGDPILATHAAAIAAAPHLRWIGYLSTTGVYGDRDGGWVDEATPPAPGQPRSRRRLEAEQAWIALGAAFAGYLAVDIFRVGGIYGPGRSAFDELRAGTARRTLKPGHAFSRIHRDDIALAVCAAMAQSPPPGPRVFNLVDDEVAESAEVVTEAARLLGVAPPPAIPYEQAAAGMSAMGRSFWTENRKVANAATKSALGIAWLYPGYRAGLAAILAAERGGEQVPDHPPQ